MMKVPPTAMPCSSVKVMVVPLVEANRHELFLVRPPPPEYAGEHAVEMVNVVAVGVVRTRQLFSSRLSQPTPEPGPRL